VNNDDIRTRMRDLKDLYEESLELEETINDRKRPFDMKRAAISDEEDDVLGLLPEKLSAIRRSIDALQGSMKSILRNKAGVGGLSLAEGSLKIRVSRARTAYRADIARCIDSVEAVRPLGKFWYPGQEKKSLDRVIGEWMVEQAANGIIEDVVVENLVTEIAASTPSVSFAYKE